MKTRSWQTHLRELLKASLDPTMTIYGARWAHDTKYAKHTAVAKRLGTSSAERASCLWSTMATK
jgi:hypothetical protein